MMRFLETQIFMSDSDQRLPGHCGTIGTLANRITLMITLYDYLPSQNAFKVRLLLSHLATAYESRPISIFEGEGKSDWYREANPMGAVPAIRLEDGRCIAESNAILGYLAEGTQYMPQGRYERAKVHQWLSFEQDYIQNTIGSLRYWTLTGKIASRPQQVVATRRDIAISALNALDREFESRSFICGEHYSIADMSLYAYASRAEEAGISLAPYANFRDWLARVESQPRFLGTVYPYSMDPLSSGEL